jgi:hypothetical protein
VTTKTTRTSRKAQQAACQHDWFEGIATQFCTKCGKQEPTARFAQKWAARTTVEARS